MEDFDKKILRDFMPDAEGVDAFAMALKMYLISHQDRIEEIAGSSVEDSASKMKQAVARNTENPTRQNLAVLSENVIETNLLMIRDTALLITGMLIRVEISEGKRTPDGVPIDQGKSPASGGDSTPDAHITMRKIFDGFSRTGRYTLDNLIVDFLEKRNTTPGLDTGATVMLLQEQWDDLVGEEGVESIEFTYGGSKFSAEFFGEKVGCEVRAIDEREPN